MIGAGAELPLKVAISVLEGFTHILPHGGVSGSAEAARVPQVHKVLRPRLHDGSSRHTIPLARQDSEDLGVCFGWPANGEP